jgi:Tol biopolymer transport system component
VLNTAVTHRSTGLDAAGTRLVFQSRARVTTYDNDGKAQVYVYDALANTTRCVSCDPYASRSTGNTTLGTGSDYGTATPRVISPDGRRIVFTSADGLVPQDTNGLDDVYEELDGRLSLVSSGTSPRDSRFVGMSADGSQIFIQTRSSLTADDVDGGLFDIYSARIDGGFPVTASSAPCDGDACQGTPAATAAPTVAGSVTFAGHGDAVPGGGRADRQVTVRAVRTIAGSAGRLRLTVPALGQVTASGSGLATTSRALRAAGSYSLDVRLTPAGRRALARRHRLRLTARLRYIPAGGAAQSTRVRLTFATSPTTTSPTKPNLKGGR